MLYVLARSAMAVIGLVLGAILGWLGAGSVVQAFDMEYKTATAGLVLPLIGLSIFGGGMIGMIAGTVLPVFWLWRREARHER